MRIGGIGARPPLADDVASALTGAASLLGQRPAITAVGPHGRSEQGFRSLAGWVAKGANLLQHEFGLRPGDSVGLGGPAGWPLATVALSAWWSGLTIVAVGTPGAEVTVLHAPALDAPRERTATGGVVFWIGDALDGSPESAAPGEESWVDAVTPHPDRPPAAQHDGGLIALRSIDAQELTQRELLGSFAADPGGPVGIVRDGGSDLLRRADAAALLAALTLRPLVTGAATVVVDADDPDRQRIADAERVSRWIA
jgi:uncharacterized protein (TIGR03089 family)